MVNSKENQTRILEASDPRPTEFDQAFYASSQLAAEYKSSKQKASEAESQKNAIPKLDGQVYLDAAKNAQQPPKKEYLDAQRATWDYDRHATAEIFADDEPNLPKRTRKRNAFLDSLKDRHDAAIKDCDDETQDIYDSCGNDLHSCTEGLRSSLRSSDQAAEDLLFPLENDIEKLGQQGEAFVQSILEKLVQGIENNRGHIETYRTTMEDIEKKRKALVLERLKVMVERCTAAAHCNPGEVERIVEERTLSVDTLTLQNSSKTSEVISRLDVQNMEKSKSQRRRWYEGLLRWKRQRHRTAVENVLQRIESREYRCSLGLVKLMEKLQAKQDEVFEQRTEFIVQVYSTETDDMSSTKFRTVEEQIGMLNDRTAEETDNIFVEVKELKDMLNHKGDSMLNQLRSELEMYDARIEWGDHESVKALVEVDIRPHLKNAFQFVEILCLEVAEVLQTLDETAHHTVVSMNTYAINLATLLETFKQQMMELRLKHQSDIEGCIQDHVEECEHNENEMLRLKAAIEDTVHIPDLDVLLEETFAQLDKIEQSYRDYAKNLIDIHRSYEPQIYDFFLAQTDIFGPFLGLARIEDKKKPALEDGEEAPEPELDENGEPIQDPMLKLADWSGVADYAYHMKQALTNAQLRLKAVPKIEEAAADEDAEEKPPSILSEETLKELSLVSNKIGRVPKTSEGVWCLQEHIFKTCFIEILLQTTRQKIFTFLHMHKSILDGEAREKLEREEMAINIELDRRLRKHVNRKGEVQVDWYNPRQTQIEKHKTKFQRHVILIARKSGAQEDEMEKYVKDVEKRAEVYNADMEALKGALGDCKSLAELTAIERKGKDACALFTEFCKRTEPNLKELATKGPDILFQLNRDFIRMCKAAAEDGFSASELEFYKGEVAKLNEAIEAKKKDRLKTLEDERAKYPTLQEPPLKDFLAAYAETVENLCSEQGLGRKYGAPRRSAQEQCRSLMSRSSQALHEIGAQISTLSDLLIGEEDPGPMSFEYKLRLQRAWKELTPPMACEIVGTIKFIVSGALCVSLHLEGLKPKWRDEYTKGIENMKALCVMDESELLAGADAKREVALYEDVMFGLVGALPKMDLYSVGVEAVVKKANDHYKGKLPDFMKDFLEKMKTSAEMHRQNTLNELREHCQRLRDEILLPLGEVVFDELSSRSLENLKQEIMALNKELNTYIDAANKKRKEHETRLTPSLANPNAAKILRKLIDEENHRHAETVEKLKKFKAQYADLLHRSAVVYQHRLHTTFQTMNVVIDALPFAPRFLPLPGDDAKVERRMSVKRRKRLILLQGHEGVLETDADLLPPRTWEGLESKLWVLPGSFWDSENEEVDKLIKAQAGAADDSTNLWIQKGFPSKAYANFSPEEFPSIESFRSPVHKRVFRSRNAEYVGFKTNFQSEVSTITGVLEKMFQKEETGAEVWEHMTNQLLSGGGDV